MVMDPQSPFSSTLQHFSSPAVPVGDLLCVPERNVVIHEYPTRTAAGYEAKFVNTLLKRHECPICLFAMRNPVQTECGHRFCKACLEPVLLRRRPICPLDKADISQEGIFPDNACRREILHLDVYCNFMTRGCVWIGPLKELEAHIGDDCSEVLRPCPNYCDSQPMKRAELQQHLAVKGGQCPLSEMNCPFKPYGCSFVASRKDIPAHLHQYSVLHSQLQVEYFVALKQQAEKNTAAEQHLLERVGSLETRVNAVERLQDMLEQRVELLDDRRERYSDQYAGRIDIVEDQVAKVTNMVAQLQRGLEEIRLSGRNSTGQSSGYLSESGLPSLGVAANVTPRRIETFCSKVTELEHSVDRCLSSSMDHDLRLQLLERATYNGSLMWKIDDFKRRRKEAVDGVTMSLYSSPFYTSRHGYKMCARVNLNGDGLGKNTHFSFFFVIMRGPYDPLLPWPFRQKVTLTLLNQTGKKHITNHFRPDPHSSSFQRPSNEREMNIASGCPMFIRIEHLLSGGFIKDDAAYIRIVVDTSDLPEIMP